MSPEETPGIPSIFPVSPVQLPKTLVTSPVVTGVHPILETVLGIHQYQHYLSLKKLLSFLKQ